MESQILPWTYYESNDDRNNGIRGDVFDQKVVENKKNGFTVVLYH